MAFQKKLSITKSSKQNHRLINLLNVMVLSTLPVPMAQAAGLPATDEIILEEIVVKQQSQALIGIADSASEGTVTAQQLKARPLLRPAEVMETVPGMIVTQHSGGGKANQYFLRGFNLDHGSDFATHVNGMPVNNVTHAHGQGYMDLNFLIPELIGTLRYRKGVYAAEDGDFAVAGSARIDYVKTLDTPFVDFSLGQYGYKRFLGAGSHKFDNVNLLAALELVGNDGPWDQSENLVKRNGVLRLSSGNAYEGYSLTAMAYENSWTATEQVPVRAIESGEIGKYGTLAPTDGGKTHRYSLNGEMVKSDEKGRWKANAYLIDYQLNLFSTPSGLLDGQHEQADKRLTWGGQVAREQDIRLAGKNSILDLGLQLRHDRMSELGLYQTSNRVRNSTTRSDAVNQTGLGLFTNLNTQWTDWLRTNVGLRWDGIKSEINNKGGEFNINNGGTGRDHQVSPKLGVVLGPFDKTEFYANWGHGFHSNDGRGSTATTNAVDGSSLQRIPLIAKVVGSEVGVRTQFLPNWHSSLTLWQVALDSELVYIGDEGVTEPKGGSKRRGVEWSNYYSHDGLILDADVAVSHARFDTSSNGGNRVPNAIPVTASLAVTHDTGGKWFGGVRARYLGAYPLEETGTLKSKAFWSTNMKLGYRYDKHIQFSIDVLNIFNSTANDIEYFGASCSRVEGAGCGGGAGIDGRLIHPLEPRSVRLGLRLSL
ncbi:TonB-dependent receptor [Methylotenera mobilis]|uniref:TonB-dependent receptor n=1 Tax=Methylotenera mobilis (strain JLW8 / ATCC BAA-1282 / DSM 17540) TaxID=583345 RepID=C6WY12_METML|nr:TonB-dependent receptor [Methylotenera mobilis]ACT48811.1 TonB-dependent receptor [Methylotenera mobilis JLW8]